MLRPRLPKAGVLFALGIALVLACGTNDGYEEDNNQFRPSVLACEEALARLIACCPGFDPSLVVCDYFFSRHEGCGSSTVERTEPAFTLAESECIADLECGELTRQNICARAEKARARCLTETGGIGAPPPPRRGCPEEANRQPPRERVCP